MRISDWSSDVCSADLGTDPYGTQAIFRTLFNSYDGGAGLVPFDRTNPYLTQDAINSLDAVSPAFAAGDQLYLARILNILTTRNRGSRPDKRRVGNDGVSTCMSRWST